MEPERKTLDVDDVSVSYVHAGKGPALVLLHGWAQSARTWSLLVPLLEKRYSVYCLDLPGFGLSDTPPRPWTIRDYGTFVDVFVRTLSLHDPIIIGHSFGARIALEYANHFPLKKLVLCATAGDRERWFRSLNAIIIRVLGPLFPAFVLWCHSYLLTPRGFADTRRIGARAHIMIQTYIRTHGKSGTDYDAISIPALLLYGERDSIAPPEAAHELHTKLRNARTVFLKNSGHFPHIDESERVFNEIVKFLDA
jgi:pimeloyl-ACP methyl ester carboxylesterase